MQTSQVSNTAGMLSASTPAKPSDANGASESFGQVLSREVAEHNDKTETQGRDNAAPAANAPAKGHEKPQTAKSASESKSTKEAAASGEATDDRAQVSDEMLALVASLSQIAAPADTKTAPPSLEAGERSTLPDAGRGRGRDIAALMNADQAKDAKDTAPLTRDGKTDAGADPVATLGKTESGLAAKDGELADTAKYGKSPEFATNLQDSIAKVHAATIPMQQHLVAQTSHVTEKLAPAVGSPAWDNALGQKITWMVAGEHQSATLTLNPPDLGPLHVVLSVSNSHASATFTAAQPEVREALESAMPRLREMLGDSGIQLGQASVNSGSPNQQGTPDQHASSVRHSPEQADSVTEAPARIVRTSSVTSGLGMVDTFV